MSEPVHLMTGTPVPAAPIPAPQEVLEVDLGDVITDMAAFRAQGLEGLGSPGIRLQPGGPGTEIFTVPHPLLLDDDQNDALATRSSLPDIAKVLLNTADDPGVFARFRAAGGRSGDVMIAWRRLGEGLDLPK